MEVPNFVYDNMEEAVGSEGRYQESTPVFTYFQRLNPIFTLTGRTTICDVPSTTKTSVPRFDTTLKGHRKSLPYITSHGAQNRHVIGIQSLKVTETNISLVVELRKEYDEFISKTNAEKNEIVLKRQLAAVRIQSIFRGYKLRRLMHVIRRPYIPKRKQIKVLTQLELQKELTEMARNLKLAPIEGLNLS
jgi:hypothetical protein